MRTDLLTAREAADRLGVKLDTLYAYVSRGRLRSVAVSGSRERRYRAQDVETLHDTRPRATPLSDTGQQALAPVIGSAICLIENGRLFYYRGQDAGRLSDTATLEEIAKLLWLDEADPEPAGRVGAIRSANPAAPQGVIERCQLRIIALGGEAPPVIDPTRPRVARIGWRILRELADCAAPSLPSSEPVHARLAAAWKLRPAGADLLRRCLVLIADHELNASTYVARCVASTGASPYAVVAAAMSALSGHRHGGETERAEGLLVELAEADDPMAVVAGRLARGERLPGFGQPLYPDGDPRAVAILRASTLRPMHARSRIELARSEFV